MKTFKLQLGFIIIGVVSLVAGCSYLKPIENQPTTKNQSIKKDSNDAVYHDFDDILIPKEMRANQKLSSVFETETITAGVLSLNGNFEPDELIDFFKRNMATDNWRLVSMFKGDRSILQFEKGNRWCVITISARYHGFQNQVEIWVTPKVDGGASGLLK